MAPEEGFPGGGSALQGWVLPSPPIRQPGHPAVCVTSAFRVTVARAGSWEGDVGRGERGGVLLETNQKAALGKAEKLLIRVSRSCPVHL